MVVPSYAVGFIYIPGFCFFYYCAVSWCAQVIEYIMAQWLYSFVCTSVTLPHNHLNVLNFLTTYHIHSVEGVSEIILGCVYSAYPFLL